jgi:adenylate cyclase
VFTALGYPVNVAARLQDMTKTLNCTVVVSEEVCKSAGVSADRLARVDVPIRGRDHLMTVCTATDPTLLASLLDDPTTSIRPEHQASAGEKV